MSQAPNGPSPRQPARLSERGHERLLGGILGFVEVAEDAVARSDDGRRLAVDEEPERVPIAGQDGVDCGALIDDLGAGSLAVRR